MTTDVRTRIRDGDPDAFAELYETYARSVYNHAFRLTADWALAEDVMAETFALAWRLRAKVTPEGGSLRPWLLGIATNAARNHRRTNRRYRAAASAAAAAGPAALTVPDPAEHIAGQVDDRRRIAAMLTALGTLKRPEREVLVLCLWENLSYAEAAAALGIPLGTVRSRLARARKRLAARTDAELSSRTGELAPPTRQTRGDHTPRFARRGTR
ncbi:RNA polymerase sigma factor [Streptomyces sp. SPB074]|uniref:RNA polymerase sigma factor n=1 Tax=Streptomyces sp. (strain SPB074) TaxID=465543 RepID=UPI00056D7B06|nr:RNA polymerase sigma factor [Streptomyces sp. SPB074]